MGGPEVCAWCDAGGPENRLRLECALRAGRVQLLEEIMTVVRGWLETELSNGRLDMHAAATVRAAIEALSERNPRLKETHMLRISPVAMGEIVAFMDFSGRGPQPAIVTKIWGGTYDAVDLVAFSEYSPGQHYRGIVRHAAGAPFLSGQWEFFENIKPTGAASLGAGVEIAEEMPMEKTDG